MKSVIRIAAAGVILAACAPSKPSNAVKDGEAKAEQPAGPASPSESDKPLAIAATAPDLAWGPCPAGMPQGCQITVLHGDPAKPNSDILLKVPAGSAIPPHWHSSAERMMLAGGELAVKYQGSAEAVLKAGSYAYGPAGLPHKAQCRSAEPCLLFIAFEGPVDRHGFDGEI